MPYHTNSDLPAGVKNHLPDPAQTIYRQAYNHAYEQYQDPDKRQNRADSLEETSHRVAWKAVKKKYEKGSDNQWHEKS